MDASHLAKQSLLESMVNAALAGHDLDPFEPHDGQGATAGYQAICKRCKKSVWVGENGLIYSLLEESCARLEEIGEENT